MNKISKRFLVTVSPVGNLHFKKSLIELKKKSFGDFNHMEIKQAALHGNMLIKHYTYHQPNMYCLWAVILFENKPNTVVWKSVGPLPDFLFFCMFATL